MRMVCSQILPGLLGKAGISATVLPIPAAIGGIYDFLRSLRIEMLIDDAFAFFASQTSTPKKISAAPGPGHKLKEFLIDTIRAGTARPGKLFAGGDHGFDKTLPLAGGRR